jgi:hypothetical protein
VNGSDLIKSKIHREPFRAFVIELNVDIETVAIASTQKADRSRLEQLLGCPHTFTRKWAVRMGVDQSEAVETVRHRCELAADGLQSEKESAIEHTIPSSAHSSLRRVLRRWSSLLICACRGRRSRPWYQIEGALKCVCKGMRKLSVGMCRYFW